MVRTIKAKDKEKKKPGRKPKLIIEDQILKSFLLLIEIVGRDLDYERT